MSDPVRTPTLARPRHAAVRVTDPGPSVSPWLPRAGLGIGVAIVVGMLATASGATGSTSAASARTAAAPPAALRTAVNPAQLSAGAPPGAKVVSAQPVHVRQPVTATPQLVSTLAANGIPTVALNAYRVAAARMAFADPSCGIGWPLLAGIGRVESDHGQYGGATLLANGTSSIPVIGPALTGTQWDYVADTDGGRLDGDPVYDHAVGPMQFIPSTWAVYGADADGDGVANPFDINDAALGAARYLCAAGGNLRTLAGEERAVLAYNHSDQYLALVLATANAYASGVAVDGPISGITTGELPPIGSGITLPVNPGPMPGLTGISGLSAQPGSSTAHPKPATGHAAHPATGGSGSTGNASSSGSGSGGSGSSSGTSSGSDTTSQPSAPAGTSSAPAGPVPSLPVPTTQVPSLPVPAPPPASAVTSALCTVTGVLGGVLPAPCPTPTR